MAEYTSTAGGYPYADNDINFRQNLLKLSNNPDIYDEIEKFRFKEIADSFLNEDELRWADGYLRAIISYHEVNNELRAWTINRYKKMNIKRAEMGLPLINIERQISKKKMTHLDQSIQSCWGAVKNICQLAKSRNGIAVRTATTQKIIQQSTSFNRQESMDENKGGIFGGFKKKQDNQGVVENG